MFWESQTSTREEEPLTSIQCFILFVPKYILFFELLTILRKNASGVKDIPLSVPIFYTQLVWSFYKYRTNFHSRNFSEFRNFIATIKIFKKKCELLPPFYQTYLGLKYRWKLFKCMLFEKTCRSVMPKGRRGWETSGFFPPSSNLASSRTTCCIVYIRISINNFATVNDFSTLLFIIFLIALHSHKANKDFQILVSSQYWKLIISKQPASFLPKNFSFHVFTSRKWVGSLTKKADIFFCIHRNRDSLDLKLLKIANIKDFLQKTEPIFFQCAGCFPSVNVTIVQFLLAGECATWGYWVLFITTKTWQGEIAIVS